jgi:hypothetical protein
MQLSANDGISLDDLIKNLPIDYEKTAIETKAFLRARKIKTPLDLMHLVLMFSGLDMALREVAGNFTLISERISDTAIQNRLEACTPWLKMVLEQMWFADIKKIPGNLRIILIDGSSLSVPGAKGTSYRLHLAIDLVNLSIVHIEVTDKHVGESLMHYKLQDGDVLVVDRGYNHPKEIIAVSSQGVLITLRLNPNSMRLYTVGGEEKINVFDELNKAKTDQVCFKVWSADKTKDYVEAWIHARRLPQSLRAEARRIYRLNSKSKNIKKETLMYAEWKMIFTTVPVDILDTDTIMELYSLRWQVELFIKRLKSLLDIDKLRAKEESDLNMVYIYGKLLFATLSIKRTDAKFNVSSMGIDPEKSRDITPWRFLKMIRDEIKSIILAASSWKKDNYLAAVEAMKERPRKRKLQTLPLKIQNLINVFG